MAFDMEENPVSMELTEFDKAKINALEIGETYTTENKLFNINRYKDGWVVTYGKTQVTLPGAWSVIGYLTH